MITPGAAKLALLHPARAVNSARRRLGQLRRRLGDGRGRRPRRQLRSGHRGADLDRSGAAECRRACAGRCAHAARREARRQRRRAGGDVAGRHGARAGRRPQLRREPVQPRHRRQAPARLGLQAVRLSHRARTRADARHRARGRADQGQWLEAGRFRAPLFRPGDADPGAGQFAQHRRGAADAGIRARPRSFAPLTGSASTRSSSPMPRSRSARPKFRCSNWSPPMHRSPTAGLLPRRMWSSACAPRTARLSTRVRRNRSAASSMCTTWR